MIDAAGLHAATFPGFTVATLEVPWETTPKHRHRTGANGSYSVDADAEQQTGMALMTQWKREPLTGSCCLTVVAYRRTARRVDIDNLAKHIMDAANGVLWVDDSQVIGLVALKAHDPANPRTTVCVSSWEAK